MRILQHCYYSLHTSAKQGFCAWKAWRKRAVERVRPSSAICSLQQGIKLCMQRLAGFSVTAEQWRTRTWLVHAVDRSWCTPIIASCYKTSIYVSQDSSDRSPRTSCTRCYERHHGKIISIDGWAAHKTSIIAAVTSSATSSCVLRSTFSMRALSSGRSLFK